MIHFVAAAAACSRQRVFCVSLGSRLSRQFKARGPVVSPALSRPLLFNGVKTVNKTTKMAADVPANEAVENNPGYCDTPDLVTTRYHVQQTMFKIKDPKASLEFYSKVLGMTLLKRLDFPEGKFTLYFLGFEQPAKIPKDPAQRTAFLFECKATIQLTHNWGTESDATFKGYHTDNDSGLIGITVDDVYKACKRFEGLGVEFAKRPDEGNMKGLAFIKDPDGYKIEIFDAAHMIAMINE